MRVHTPPAAAPRGRSQHLAQGLLPSSKWGACVGPAASPGGRDGDLDVPPTAEVAPLSRRYMITSLDRTHAGFYRCIVRNRMGALLQRQTEVQVACK